MTYIPYGKQSINSQDIESVCEVLESDFLTQGPKVVAFEQAMADYCGAKYAVASNSATSSLHLACLALGVGPGDSVWTSPISFIASSNCALYCGAEIDFVDICPKTYNMSVECLEAKLVKAAKQGTLPKVVIPVHLAGQSCDMKAIHRLAQRYGFYIVEDASHAVGGEYLSQKVGSCEYSDITVFSFHPVKVMTTGEGGMALTNSNTFYKSMKQLGSQGVTRDTTEMVSEPDGPWYYQMTQLGFNYRMNDMQAALGLSQLARLDEFIERRQAIADYYFDALAHLPLILPFQETNRRSSWHLYIIGIDEEKSTITRRDAFQQLRSKGIGVNVHYIPIHTQPFYQNLGFKPGAFPEAEHYYKRSLSLPIFVQLTKDEQTTVIDALEQVFL